MQPFLTLIDAHVHIHEVFRINNFINSAFVNFRKNADKISAGIPFAGVLCLTESENKNYFEDLYNKTPLNNHSILKTKENNSFICTNNIGEKIFIFAGRQIVSAEKLEILGLGLKKELKDGKNINYVIDFVLSEKGVPVIPWGAGKWIGRRGKIVSKLLNENRETPLFLGDNSNRPFFWRKPKIFSEHKLKEINLPGTDPLPFKEEESRVGSFGFYINDMLSETDPFTDFKKKIFETKSPLKEYGNPESTFRFFKNQIKMQLKKRIDKD